MQCTVPRNTPDMAALISLFHFGHFVHAVSPNKSGSHLLYLETTAEALSSVNTVLLDLKLSTEANLTVSDTEN